MNKLVINEWISMKEQLAKNNATEEESIEAIREFMNTHSKEEFDKIIEINFIAGLKFLSGQYEGIPFLELVRLEFESEE